MAGSMEMISKRCFPQAVRVTDRFHVQKLATEALQEMRIKHRWEAMDAENEAIERSKRSGIPYQPEVLANGDSLKQLLARSRYVLYKKPSAWTESQKVRSELLFDRFPDLKTAYGLSMSLSQLFETTKDKVFGLANLARWHEKVRQTGFKSFNTISRSIKNHYQTILNYFDNRSTNASAESFNAKIKMFRNPFLWIILKSQKKSTLARSIPTVSIILPKGGSSGILGVVTVKHKILVNRPVSLPAIEKFDRSNVI